MTDEEKKTIDKLKNGKKYTLVEIIRVFKKEGIENFRITRKEYIDVILNLIEKQSKEIEELKAINKKLEARKLQDMTFEYFNDNELQSIVGQYLMDFLKEIIKRDYISKKKLYEHIEMLEKENCHETCGIKKLIDCGRQCSIGCTIKNIKKILDE